MRKVKFMHPRTTDTASTYVGDINDIWVDDTSLSTLRRGDGSTPGGITIGGADYTDSDVETLFQSYDFHILPDVDNTIDIGSATKKIRDLYVSENSIHIGNNTLRTSGTNLLLNGEDVMDYANFKNKPTSGSGTMPLTLIKTLTADYTTVTADHGYYIRIDTTNNVTITLVSDGTENIPIGTTMIVGRLNSGAVTFVAGSGATVLAMGTLTMSTQNGKVTVMKTAANTWEINGDLTL